RTGPSAQAATFDPFRPSVPVSQLCTSPERPSPPPSVAAIAHLRSVPYMPSAASVQRPPDIIARIIKIQSSRDLFRLPMKLNQNRRNEPKSRLTPDHGCDGGYFPLLLRQNPYTAMTSRARSPPVAFNAR